MKKLFKYIIQKNNPKDSQIQNKIVVESYKNQNEESIIFNLHSIVIGRKKIYYRILKN